MTLATVSRYDADAVGEAVGDRAVVVGGSVAGLLAARVLADAFERVVVLERDDYPDDPASRPGVPQGAHIHALQEAGRATLEDLFPGYSEAVISAGGLQLDGMRDLRFFSEGDYLADGPQRFAFLSATRPLFEHVLRRRVAALDGVDLRTGRRVTDYCLDEAGTAVTGVALRGDGGESRLGAALVVDATGRTSRTPDWLADNGYAAPRVDEVEVGTVYSTTAVRRPPADRRAILAIAEPPRTRGGAAFPVEGDRWLVNLHGVHGDDPPTDGAAFEGFAESLPTPELAEILDAHAQTWDAPDVYPFPSSRRHRYEDLDRFPDGLVVIGDAVASFNPIYGQGMSVAAMQALVLHHAIARDGLADLPRRYFARAEPVVENAWRLAVGADAGFAETTGPVPRGSGLFGRYLSRLTRRAHDDGRLREALFRVIGMEQPATALLRPRVAARVLRPRLPRRSGDADAAAASSAPAGGPR